MTTKEQLLHKIIKYGSRYELTKLDIYKSKFDNYIEQYDNLLIGGQILWEQQLSELYNQNSKYYTKLKSILNDPIELFIDELVNLSKTISVLLSDIEKKYLPKYVISENNKYIIEYHTKHSQFDKDNFDKIKKNVLMNIARMFLFQAMYGFSLLQIHEIHITTILMTTTKIMRIIKIIELYLTIVIMIELIEQNNLLYQKILLNIQKISNNQYAIMKQHLIQLYKMENYTNEIYHVDAINSNIDHILKILKNDKTILTDGLEKI